MPVNNKWTVMQMQAKHNEENKSKNKIEYFNRKRFDTWDLFCKQILLGLGHGWVVTLSMTCIMYSYPNSNDVLD